MIRTGFLLLHRAGDDDDGWHTDSERMNMMLVMIRHHQVLRPVNSSERRQQGPCGVGV